MPQGLVPVIISQLRLSAVAHKGTKDCTHYLCFVFIMMSVRHHVIIVTHPYSTFTDYNLLRLQPAIVNFMNKV